MFYMDLLCTWSEMRYVNKFEVKDIPNEILWNNSNVVIDNKPLYFPSWIKEKGIGQIKHVINRGTWIDNSLFNTHCDIKNLLFLFKMSKLKKAFPTYWSQNVRLNKASSLNETTDIETTSDVINVECTTAKSYYSLMQEKKKEKNCFHFCQNISGLPETFVWKDVFQFKFNKIRDNNIKQYNFKLIHRILPSKDNLFIWKIVQSNEYEICREKKRNY